MEHVIVDETKPATKLAEKRRALKRQHATMSDSTTPTTPSSSKPVSPSTKICLPPLSHSPPPRQLSQSSPLSGGGGAIPISISPTTSSIIISSSHHRISAIRSPLPPLSGGNHYISSSHYPTRSCTPYRSNESMLSIRNTEGSTGGSRKKVCLKNSSRPSLRDSSRALSADCRSPSSTENRLYIQRQKTTESVPTYMSNHMISWNSSRQQSLSHGPSRMTLIRGESCSLVDIPTYISSSIELGCIANPPMQIMMNQQRPTRPRLRIDLTKRKPAKKEKQKTRWTVVCVSVMLMCMCIGLVGTMLSITTEYQDRKVSDMLIRKLPLNTSLSEDYDSYTYNSSLTLIPNNSTS